MKRALYALVLLVYMSTPYVALGFQPGTCQCLVDGKQCGTNGALCHCCLDELRSSECDSAPAFTSCKGPTGVQVFSQPPAIAEPMAPHPYVYTSTGHMAIDDIASSHGFHLDLIKPPRTA